MQKTITINGNDGTIYKIFKKDKLGSLKVRCMTIYKNGIKIEWGCFDTLKQAGAYVKKYLIDEKTEEIPLF